LAEGKVCSSPDAAVSDVFDGAALLVGGFASAGLPESLIRSLLEKNVGDLTCIFSGDSRLDAVPGVYDVSRLVENGQVRKLISPLPFYPGSGGVIEQRLAAGELEIEVIPQGVLAERLRAGGVGLGGIFLSSGIGTRFEQGKETRIIDGRKCLLEMPLKADFALLKASTADTLGNLVYSGTERNWGPVMNMAGAISIVEAGNICEPGQIDPELVITPGIFVNRVVRSTVY